jgi:hypothetical protein
MGTTTKDWEAKGFKMESGKLVPVKKVLASNNVPKKPYNKYGNRKIIIDEITFDSEKEGRYYERLKLLKLSGEIKDFKRQVKYDIAINGIHIAYYILDFEVENPDGIKEYIDVKALTKQGKWITTDVFSLKKKLVEAIYKIKIKLV